MKPDQQTKPQSAVFNYEDDDAAWVESLNGRIDESKGWFDKKYKLDKKAKESRELYYAEEILDDANSEEEVNLENRIFTSIRTMIPYVVSQITQPEIYPSSNAEAAKKFAEDLEKALYAHADAQQTKQKTKFAIEDAIIEQRGYLKLRADLVNGNFCAIEYVPADSIIVDHKAKPYEELRHFRHLLDRTVEDLLVMFPDMETKIKQTFNINDSTPKSELLKSHVVNEDWCFVPGPEGLDLVVTWHYKGLPLGKMQDPNWRYGKTNFIEHHMMPLVEFNVLSDGRTHVDRTSFVQQAKLPQKNLDRRTTQISKNAGLGNTGMPVVDTAALADDQSQYLSFDEDTVLELDVSSANGTSINDVFTVWKAGPLPEFVYTDKLDTRTVIDNIFGTPAILQGEKPSDTLGQDVLLRDQATARLQEVVDAIDSGMDRLYKLLAQFLLVYGNEQEMFRFVGENTEFDYIILNTDDLDTNVTIRAKSGTSMPIDRPQRRAVAKDAAAQKMLDPLTYWEIMDPPNAQKYAKRVMDFMANPAGFLKDTEEEVFNRDAFVDIELLKHGAQPPFRDDLSKEYFDHLNKYVLSGDLDNPKIAPDVKANIQAFIQMQLMRGQKMLGMLTTQSPPPPTVPPMGPQGPMLPAAAPPGAVPAPAAQAAPVPVQ